MNLLSMRLLTFILFCFTISISWSQTCTFNNGGGDNDWENDANWSCGHEPDTDVDDIVIPAGQSVVYSNNANLEFNDVSVTINGDADFGNTAHLHFKDGSSIDICNAATVIAFELKIEDGATSTICDGVDITLEELEIKDGGTIVIDAASPCVTVTDADELKLNGDVSGDGCVNGTDIADIGLITDTCTFNGNVNNDWDNAGNWSCGNVPDGSSENVIIPNGFTVEHDADLNFEGNLFFTLEGSLDMGNKKLKIKTDAYMTVASTGILFNTSEYKFEKGGDGILKAGADVDVTKLKTKDASILTINSCSVVADTELKTEAGTGGINGSGCVDFTPGNFTNTGDIGIFGCTDATFAACSLAIALPVEFGGVKASTDGQRASILWETYSEKNNSHFLVMASKDLQDFNVIDEVKGAGTSYVLNSYISNFSPLEPGVWYFKIRQVDYDGKYADSEIVFANIQDVYNSLKSIVISPNPSTHSFKIMNLLDSMTYQISIYSTVEGIIISESIDYENNVIMTGNLANGLYLVYLTDEKLNVTVLKLLKE